MTHCEICSRRLSLRCAYRSWRRGTASYPVRLTRQRAEEQPARWVCAACDERATRIRTWKQVQPLLERRRAPHEAETGRSAA
ncbi:MAG: hypothetical protein ACK47B_26440 [Armatimonadota bacterium]